MSTEESSEATTTTSQGDGTVDYEHKGTVDLVSALYVVAGIPLMIAFFVILFGLVGACDAQSVYIPA